jgi:hypothetical protein
MMAQVEVRSGRVEAPGLRHVLHARRVLSLAHGGHLLGMDTHSALNPIP